MMANTIKIADLGQICVVSGNLQALYVGMTNTNTASVLAIDGTNLLHRTYHAMIGSDLRSPTGDPLWALHGLAGLVAKYVDQANPKWLVLTFDVPGSSAPRKLLDPGYKGGRSEAHADLVYQLEQAPELFRKAGLSVLTVEQREADDSLAAIAFLSQKVGIPCQIVSADRDALRLIGDGTTVLHPDGRVLDNAFVIGKYDVPARRYPELSALVGEDSDNLPGVPGIGPKGAAKIVNNCDHISSLLTDPAAAISVAGDRLGKLITTHAQRVELNLKIATPMSDMDVRGALKNGEIPVSAQLIREVFTAAYLPNAGDRLARMIGKTLF